MTTQTPWQVFANAGKKIERLTCRGYRPYHRLDRGCKARLWVEPGNIVGRIRSHIENHSGGFYMKLADTDAGPGQWAEFHEGNVEIVHIMCDVCQQAVRLNTRSIQEHCKIHLNGNRKSEKGGLFRVTLAFEPPIPDEDEGPVEFAKPGTRIIGKVEGKPTPSGLPEGQDAYGREVEEPEEPEEPEPPKRKRGRPRKDES